MANLVSRNARGNSSAWANMNSHRRKPAPLASFDPTPYIDGIKLACSRLKPHQTISTRDLVDMVCGDDRDDMKDCFAVTRQAGALAELEAYWTRGAVVRGMNGNQRPFLWHAPYSVCPHCQGTGYLARMAGREAEELLAAVIGEPKEGLTLEERRAIVDADENGWSA